MEEEIGLYRPGDETEILNLFGRVFGENRDMALWKWENQQNPRGESIIALLHSGERIRAHLCLQQILLHIRGREVPAAQRINTMMEEECRGSGWFAPLLKLQLEEAQKRGVELIYSFPNHTALRALQRSGEVTELGEVPHYIKVLRAKEAAHRAAPHRLFASIFLRIALSAATLFKNRRRGNGSRTRRLWEFDGRFDELWKQAGESFGITTARCSSFLNWRYRDCPREYLLFERPRGEKGTGGYIVLRFLENVCYILDLLALDRECLLDLLDRAEDEARVRSCSALSCWCLDGGRVSSLLKELGYMRRKSKTTFVFTNIQCPEDIKGELENRSSWYIMLGDSDYV